MLDNLFNSEDNLSDDMYVKPNFVSPPKDETLPDRYNDDDEEKALQDREHVFARIFFGFLFLSTALLYSWYGMAMVKFLIAAFIISSLTYLAWPKHLIPMLCRFWEGTSIISALMIGMKMQSSQAMIQLLEAFLTLVCRMAYHMSDVPKVEATIHEMVKEIKAGNTSATGIKDYQNVRMKLLTLRMTYLTLNSLLSLFIVFFLLVAKPWSWEDSALNQFSNKVGNLETKVGNFETKLDARINEVLTKLDEALQKRD